MQAEDPVQIAGSVGWIIRNFSPYLVPNSNIPVFIRVFHGWYRSSEKPGEEESVTCRATSEGASSRPCERSSQPKNQVGIVRRLAVLEKVLVSNRGQAKGYWASRGNRHDLTQTLYHTPVPRLDEADGSGRSTVAACFPPQSSWSGKESY